MLRTTLALAGALLGLALLTGRLPAGPREEALALLQKAIKAHGGEEGMLKLHNCTRKGEGLMTFDGREQPFTDVFRISLPDKIKHVADINRRAQVVTVLNGEQGWTMSGGTVMPMSKELRDDLLEEVYVWALCSLVPLTRGGGDLAPVAEIKVDDRPAVGVRIASKGKPEARLYFDKETHLLVRITRQARQAGVPFEKEYVFRAFREFDGVKLPTRVVETAAGSKLSELKNAVYELRKNDDSQFVRP